MKLTANQLDALELMIQFPNRSSVFFPASLRRVLSKLVERGLALTGPSDRRGKGASYRATEAGKVAYYAALGER